MSFKHSEIESLDKAGLYPRVVAGKVETKVSPPVNFVAKAKPSIEARLKEVDEKIGDGSKK